MHTDKEKAEQDYLKGMKYKDLADKYGVTINTIKSWKQRYKWNRNSVHTKEEGCTQKKNVQVLHQGIRSQQAKKQNAKFGTLLVAEVVF
jgi:phage terminase small subunit